MMQFHLNGFRPGDPHISEADVRHQADGTMDALPKQVDVLIVGCGPTGLTLASQLAAFPDITTRIVSRSLKRLFAPLLSRLPAAGATPRSGVMVPKTIRCAASRRHSFRRRCNVRNCPTG